MKKLLLASTIFTMVAVAGPAQAGPLAAGIGALFTSLGAVGSTLGGIALSLGSSWLFQTLFAPETKQRGIKQDMETGGDNPPAFIVGEYTTPGQLLYVNVLDEGDIPNQCLVYVIGLSALPIDSVSNEMLIQGERCHLNLGSSWPGGFKEVSEYVKGGSGGGYCLMKFYDGKQTGADSWLRDKFGSDPLYPIDADCWWRGMAYVIIQCWYSNRGIWTGLPEFKFTVRGLPMYDPRKDTTNGGGASGPQRWALPGTWTFTLNPKVIEYNFIRGVSYGGEWQWGGNAEAYRLPLEYWFAAMNVCDQNVVTAGGTINRYEIAGEIHYDDDPREIINEINKSCSGYTTEYGGVYKTWCGEPGLSVMTITDADFVIDEERESTLFLSPQETYNTGYGTYPEPRQKWEPKETNRFRDPDAYAEDGVESAIEVNLPFVTNANQVQRVVRAMIKDSRRQIQHPGQLPPAAYVLEPHDRVTFISAEEGYIGDGKDFLIASKDDLPNVNQAVVLRELDITDTAWLPEYELEETVGNVGNILPGDLALAFTITPDQVVGAGGRERPAIAITWDWFAPDIDVRRVLWKIRNTVTTKKVDEGAINRPQDGDYMLISPSLRFGVNYEISFLILTEAPRAPVWGGWQAITMLPSAPDAPTSLTATGKHGRIVLKTTKSTDPLFGNWNLYASNTNDFTTATLIDDPRAREFSEANLGNGVTRYYWIKTVDRWGTESTGKFPASDFGGRVATTVRVADDDLDQTAPGVPIVAMVGYGDDFDEDSKIDAGMAITLTHPNTAGTPTGVRVVRYIVHLRRSTTVGGTYIDFPKNWHSIDAEDTPVVDPVDGTLITTLHIPLNRKYFYKARARAIAFGSKKGAFSGYTTTGIKPTALTGYTGAAVGAPGVVGIANGYVVTAALGALDRSLFKEMEILVGGVTLIKVPTLSYQDMTPRAIGATPSYTVRLYDIVGNVTAGSIPATVAPAYRAALAGEVGVLGNANMGIGAVLDVNIGGQLSESKTRLVGDGNLIRNPAFRSGSADGWSLFGVATVVSRAAAAVANAPANFVYELPGNSAFSTIFVGNPVDKFEVSGGETFAARLYFAAAAVTGSGVIHLSARFENGAADGIYNFATFCVASLTTLDAGNAWVEVKGLVEVPALVNGQPTSAMTMYVEKGSGFTGGKAYFAKPRVRRATDNDMLAANAVTSANILDGAVIAAKIADAAISTAKFAATVKPVEIFATQAAAGTATLNRVIFSIADAKLYKGNGTAWVSVVNAADMTGTLADAQIAAVAASKVTGQLTNAQIADVAAAKVSGQLTNSQIADLAAAKISGQVVASQIADAAITNAKFAAGIEPIEILGTLPTTGNFAGRMVFLTTDNKLYRHNGTSFIASIAATDMSGQIVGTQITDGAITTAKMTANSISGDRITAGTLDASKIVADSITAGQIAAGAISATELAAGAVTAGKIAAGTIVAADIAADTITGAKIAAGTITSSEILAGTITATEIAAATITGAKIAADTIVAGNIAANAITAAELAAGAVTAGKIAAGTIVAADIATGAITAGKIAAGTIVAADIAADTITAGQIAAGAVSASELAAGAVIAGKIAAGAITANEIAANTITGAKIAAGTITTDRLATLSLTAANATIGNIDISNANIGTLQVDNINLASGSIVQIAEFSGPAGIACAAGVFTECGSITINHGTKSQGVIVMGTGVNGSGGTRTIDLRISNAGGAILSEILGVQVADNGQFSIPLSHVPIVASTTYRLLVKPAAAFTAAARRMVGFGAKA